jgi:hypothetical protein
VTRSFFTPDEHGYEPGPYWLTLERWDEDLERDLALEMNEHKWPLRGSGADRAVSPGPSQRQGEKRRRPPLSPRPPLPSPVRT